MKRNAVDKLYKLENGLPLSMDEIEELTMLLVQADPDNSNHYPFWISEICKVELDPTSPRFNQFQECRVCPTSILLNRQTRQAFQSKVEKEDS